MFTEQDLQQQEEELARLREELSILDSHFATLVKAGNFSLEELQNGGLEPIPQELEKLMAEAKTKAADAGSARAMQSQSATTRGKIPGSVRRGIVRL